MKQEKISATSHSARVRFRPGDVLIFLLFLAIIIFSVSLFWFGAPGATLRIETPTKTWTLPLSEDQTMKVQGECGEMTIQVQAGAVRVLESSCPNETCLHFGRISKKGEVIVCVPNKVSIRIEGDAEEGESVPDAITR